MNLFPGQILAACLLSSCALFAQQSAPAKTVTPPRLCVAALGNGSLKPILVNDVKDELLKDLVAAGLNVDSASTATLVAKKLELSGNNQESFRFRRCDLMLLTAVDSAKPAAASTTPAPGSQLLLSFALFKKNVVKPLIDTAVEAPVADTPTQSILKVVNQEAEQVRQVLAKK
jgi:hypothetical protein